MAIIILAWMSVFHPALSQELPQFEDSREGLNAMMEFILTASEAQQKALTDSLQPLLHEYDSLFYPPYPKKVAKYHKRLRKMADIIIKPIWEDQQEILIWEASVETLAQYQGEARHFPGAYAEQIDHFIPGKTLYRIKFVQPGRKRGTAFDVFVFVNGHWRIFHRPWTVMK